MIRRTSLTALFLAGASNGVFFGFFAALYILFALKTLSLPTAVLGMATGSTPVPFYRELIRLHREEGLSFAFCSGNAINGEMRTNGSAPAQFTARRTGD